MQADEPELFEDAAFGYPEATAVTHLLVADVDLLAQVCAPSALLELFLDSERHLSLFGRAETRQELRGNATAACARRASMKRLVAEVPEVAADAETTPFRVADAHLRATWRRLAVEPDGLCAAVAEGSDEASPLPFDLAGVDLHSRCRSCGSGPGGLEDAGPRGALCGCHGVASGAELGEDPALGILPSAVREAIALRQPVPGGAEALMEDGFLATGAAGLCGEEAARAAVRPERPGLLEASSEPLASDDEVAAACFDPRGSPASRRPSRPSRGASRCKACIAGRLLALRRGDRVLDLSGGCGDLAVWLTLAFDVRATVLDPLQGRIQGAVQASRLAGVPLAAACRADLAMLAAFTDNSFEAIVAGRGGLLGAGGAARWSVPVACAALRAHLLRLLRPGGALWWSGILGDDADSGEREQWLWCLSPLAAAGEIAYAFVDECRSFGATDAASCAAQSLFLAKMAQEGPGAAALGASFLESVGVTRRHAAAAEAAAAVSRRHAGLYACAASAAAGFAAPPGAAAASDAVASLAPGLPLPHFEPGPSFWPCVEERLLARAAPGAGVAAAAPPAPRRLAKRLWAAEGFASAAEAAHGFGVAARWRREAAGLAGEAQRRLRAEAHAGLWVDDVIAPTGADPVLDMLEERLQDVIGLPAAQSDPWHILWYDPGYEGHWPHTDCNHPGFEVGHDRAATALLWLSPEPQADEDLGLKDGATVFANYGLRVRLPQGGLAVYGNMHPGPDGACDNQTLHYAAPLDSAARGPKVLLQKWFYERLVEPSSPETPRAICTDAAGGGAPPLQCKFFLTAPGHGAVEVQDALAAFHAGLAKLEGAADVEAFLTQVAGRLLRALEAELPGRSLGVTASARALYMGAHVEVWMWQLGLAPATRRRGAVDKFRAALRRCPFCEDMLSFATHIMVGNLVLGPDSSVVAANEAQREVIERHCGLAEQGVLALAGGAPLSQKGGVPSGGVLELCSEMRAAPLAAAQGEALEALEYARRLAAIGTGGAASLAAQAMAHLRARARGG